MSRRRLDSETPQWPQTGVKIPKKFLFLFDNFMPDGVTPVRYKCAWGGRGGAKAIALSEEVPTPNGWKQLGAIEIGDQVFDESGMPCLVTAIHENTPATSYRFLFSDGATVDCCADHEWVTWTHAERKSLLRSPYDDHTRFPDEWPVWRRYRADNRWGNSGYYSEIGPQIRTTQEIIDTLTYGSRGDFNHCIPLCGPLTLPEIELPVDPYVLGYWLGNGVTSTGRICCGSYNGEIDYPHVASVFGESGHALTFTKDYDQCKAAGLPDALAAAGLLNNKCVPDIYLRASYQQRLALLRGLMDSDGTADLDGVGASFSNTNQALAYVVFELVISLGQKPTWHVGRAILNGVDHGEYVKVNWRPSINPFTLPRKAKRVKAPGRQALRSHHRMIVAVESIPSVPMRCLTVDSPNHMYLVTRWMIPTHNSYNFARALVSQAYQSRHLILCTREFQNTIADSVKRVIERQIIALGLGQWFDVTENSIKARLSGSEFIFKGLRRDIQGIRSLEGVTRAWIEEAQFVTKDSLLTLDPTIREPGSQIWASYNPLEDTDAIHQLMVINTPPNALVFKTSYRDNPYFPAELEILRKQMLALDPDSYDWVWEGNTRKISSASIFRNHYIIEDFDEPEIIDRLFFGVDWGFSNDPLFATRSYIHNNELFVTHEFCKIGVELDDIKVALVGGRSTRDGTEYEGLPDIENWPIKADNARPETISYVSKQGLGIAAAEKWQGSVEDGITHLKGFRRIHIHPRCTNLAHEFRMYSFKTDPKVIDPRTGEPEILPTIIDRWNHGIDSLRYGLDGYIQKRGGLGVWSRL